MGTVAGMVAPSGFVLHRGRKVENDPVSLVVLRDHSHPGNLETGRGKGQKV